MSLFAGRDTSGHLSEAIVHFNHALDKIDSEASHAEVARALFDGLNKIRTEWLLHQQDQQICPDQQQQRPGEVKSFQLMILNLLQPEAQSEPLMSSGLRSLVDLEPQIMNHDTLRRHRYRPEAPITPQLSREATKEHRKLANAWHDLETGRNPDILKRTAELLYIVRSNIAHGEKTPYGSDLAKRKRDEQVCAVVVPLQLKLFDLLLDWPSRKLVVYGTLDPGQANHGVLADVAGEWQECELRGSIGLLHGLPVLSWNPNGAEVKAQLLSSSELPRRWEGIDAFEGNAYKRRLVPLITTTGILVAYVYLSSRASYEVR
jgi:gamma-glutamylcyclotransferase (GGCT)/AIG2-like uncharacterized protein YtfP